MEKLFEIKNLSAGYEKKVIIKDVNLSAKSGEILALIGPNGAGKSTLLKTVSGQKKPMTGEVFITGESVYDMDKNQRAKKMSSLFTDRHHAELLKCYDVVSMGRYPYTKRLGILSEKDKSVVEDVMKRFDIIKIKDEYFDRLSDGQKQRVLLARAIAQKPEVLILDEPVTYLDIRYQLELMSGLRSLAGEGLFIMISMHELSLVRKYADRLLCIKDGGAKEVLNVDEFFENGHVEELFDIPKGSL